MTAPLTSAERAALREAAEKATPLRAYGKQPFAFEGSVEESVWWRAVLSARDGDAFVIVEDTDRERTQAEHDFIAAASPSTILSLLDENEELRKALGGIDQHMVWSAHYVSGNTFAVMCRCGWVGDVEGDDSSFKKRAAVWADHVRARAALSEEVKEETK